MRFIIVFLAVALTALPAYAGGLELALGVLANVAGVGATLGTLGLAVFKVVVGVGFSLAAQLLQGKPKVNPQGIQTEQTTTGDVTPQKFVLGRYGLEGHLVAPAMTHGILNAWMSYVLEVSNIPVTGITDRVAIDGKWYNIDKTTANLDPKYGWPLEGLSVHGVQYGWIKFYDGTQTTADPTLVAEHSADPDRPWTSAHVLRGTAYAILTFRFNQKLFPGFPGVRFEIDGIRLYDPRKDSSVGGSGSQRWNNKATWGFTRNPQVMVYNIVRGIELPSGDIWGSGVPAEDLPLADWFAAMNECDDLIGARIKYQAGFEVDVSTDPVDVIEELNKASFTQLSEFGGVFRPRTGPPGSAVFSITDDDLVITEPSDLDPFPGLDKTNNGVTATYVRPGAIYQGEDAGTILNPAWEAEDGDRRLMLDLGLPAVTNVNQARHLMNSFINDARRFRTHRIILPPNAAILEPLDAITWTSDRNGYTGKIFEVVQIEDRLDTVLQVLTIRERDAGDVDWVLDDEIPEPPDTTPVTPPADLIPTLTLAPEEVQDSASEARRPGIRLSWPVAEAASLDLLRYEVRVAATGADVTDGVVAAGRGFTIVTGGIVGATAYEVRAQYQVGAYPTDWSAWLLVTTPDLRIGYVDLDDIVRNQIDAAEADAAEALARHDAALDDATGVVEELKDRVEQAFGPLGLPLPADPLATTVETLSGSLADTDQALAAFQQSVNASLATNTASIQSLQASKVDGAGAVAAIDNVVNASFGSLNTFSEFTQWARANENGANAGFVFELGGSNVLSAVKKDGNGNTQGSVTIKFDADNIILSGDVQVLDSFFTNVLQAKSAWITNAMIANLSASKVTTGVLNTSLLNIDGVTLSVSGGKLIVKNNGISTAKLQDQAATQWYRSTRTSFTPTAQGTSQQVLLRGLTNTGLTQGWRVIAGAMAFSGNDIANVSITCRRRIKRTSSTPWSAWVTLAPTFSFGLENADRSAVNFFESWSGAWNEVQYQLLCSYTRLGSNVGGGPCQNAYLLVERQMK